MKITCLLENTAHRSDVTAEHGLSLYIEANRQKILFDMGQSDLFAKNARVVTVGDTYKLSNHLSLYSCNEKERKHSSESFGLNQRIGKEFRPDSFLHEQYLLIEEDGNRVLISGCSHKGILNIVEWFRPTALVGGFHVSKMPLDKPLAELARALDAFPTAYYTCHCTGVEQFAHMKQFLPRLHAISCGQTLTL